MMIKSNIILILLTTTLIFPIQLNDSGIIKKIEKRVQKIFKRDITNVVPVDKLPVGFQDAGGEIYNQYIVKTEGEVIGYVIHGMTHVCYFGGCSVFTDQSKNVNREEVKYILYFSTTYEIKYIEITDFESNYGYEISAKWWLKQFYNKRPGSFEIGEDIDGISGATVSCEQFVNTLNQLIENE